jgi:serine/threonine protein kinase
MIFNVSAKLKMVECGHCHAKTFISAELPAMETTPCAKCGHPVMAPVTLRHFELRSVIASGGMGTVFRAFDMNLHREVAIKILKPDMSSDPEIMASFFREARAGAALNHTNIIHIYTFDVFEGQVFLVMELADRGSLDTRIEKGGFVPEPDVLDVGIKVASALDKALQHGLLHRDIKPGNILYNSESEPKLIDFGLAREAEAGIGDENTVWGTPYYVAPEKIRREAETFLSDLYSLGATLYQALTGHVPFEAPTPEEVCQAHVDTPLTPPNHLRADISQELSDAIVRAMAKEPADRFQSYDEFRLTLEIARGHYWRRVSQEGTGGAAEAITSKGWWKK